MQHELMAILPTLAYTFENPEQGSLTENLVFIGLGFGYVLVVLVLMFLLTTLIGLYFKREEEKRTAARTAAVATAKPMHAPEGVAPELVAVLAAAVKTVVDEPYRIVSIRHAPTDWSREGRRSIFESHRISRNRR